MEVFYCNNDTSELLNYCLSKLTQAFCSTILAKKIYGYIYALIQGNYLCVQIQYNALLLKLYNVAQYVHQAFSKYEALLNKFADAIGPLLDSPPPNLRSLGDATLLKKLRMIPSFKPLLQTGWLYNEYHSLVANL